MSITTRIISLIVTLMIAIFFLYNYSNRKTTGVIEGQIDLFNKTRMAYFRDQIDRSVGNASTFAFNLTNDPDVQLFSTRYASEFGYDHYQIYKVLEQKLILLNGNSNPWNNWITLYFPATESVVSTTRVNKFDAAYLQKHAGKQWYYEESNVLAGIKINVFTHLYASPNLGGEKILKSPVVVEVTLPADNVIKMLDTFKTTSINDPLYYFSTKEYVLNSTANKKLIAKLLPTIDGMNGNSNREIVELEGKKYLVYVETSAKMGWKLVDYVPLGDILQPVNKTNQMFYSIIGLLLLLGIGASILLYAQIQVPIRMLMRGVKRLKEGKLSTRITTRKHNEFQQLFDQFNQMATEIQHLIEKVYLEEIRLKEAVMKQLQSQINPHFLYNCFAFIISMAKLKRNDAIITMSYNLSDYYKYATRNEYLVTTLKDEVTFVGNYLDIMKMQLNRFEFAIQIDPSLEELIIPRLLIQPIVENAVFHGLEPKLGTCSILITAVDREKEVIVTVEDDGIGMQDRDIARLNERITHFIPPKSGLGLWNVNQRLFYTFGQGSVLTVERSSSGGICVRMLWFKKPALMQQEEE